MKKNIVIIGDSFAGASSKPEWPGPGLRYTVTHPVWTDIITDHYNYNLKLFGYIGKSWWFSYSQFEKWKQQFPDEWENTDLIIVIHTDYARFNSSNKDVPNLLGANVKHYSPERMHALTLHQIHLYDDNFNKWAQNQFFKLLAKLCKNKKIINIPVMEYLSKEPAYYKCKAGVLVMDDLLKLSKNEMIVPGQSMRPGDPRICHFSPKNHVVLANELINIVDNYKPGPTRFRPNVFHKAII